MAGQEFVDINMGNLHLRDWIVNTAGGPQAWHQPVRRRYACSTRTRKLACSPYQPSPPAVGDPSVTVHPDCHVVITGSFYSVPFVYVGQELAAHVSENFVEIYKGWNGCHPPAQHPGWTVHTPMDGLIHRQKLPI